MSRFAGRLGEVCKMGQGADTCSFIVGSMAGFRCAKMDDSLHRGILQRRASGSMRAMGDNCDGFSGDLEKPA